MPRGKVEPRYIGHVNFAPMDPYHPEIWRLEDPFGQVTSDGYLMIARPGREINGASIPSFLWPILGHPFKKNNKFWSVHHDQGYTGDVLVIRLSDIPDISPELLLMRRPDGTYIYEAFEYLHVERKQRWFDWAMREAMGLGDRPEPRWKKWAAWAGVRTGGWVPWRRYRK